MSDPVLPKPDAPLDAAPSHPYMPPTMIRFLVTLLVLMSGLAAEGGAADACAFGGRSDFGRAQIGRAEVGRVELVQGAARVVARQVSGVRAIPAFVSPAPALVLAEPAALALPLVTVLPGIDRARE